ncbi:MAG: hypothetical protein HS104_22455 [Polyangiaceae bacterium]|nr:hypothetical protein [Polyangiaceae bacterium]
MTRAVLIAAGILLFGGCSSTSTNEGGPNSSSGCADGSVEQAYGDSPIMVGCAGNVNQCNAETLCSPGWHLCTYAEYVARGGANEKATSQRWLAGCVRALGSSAASCPSDDESVCGSSCASGSAEKVDVRFSCDAGAPGASDQANLGLLSSITQMRPGCVSADCSYAEVMPASAKNFGATCCK